MDDNKLIAKLLNEKVLTWEVFGSTGYLRITGRNLKLTENSFNSGYWAIYSLPCFVGVKVLRNGLVQEWPLLDLDALEAEGERLNEWFRSQPDW